VLSKASAQAFNTPNGESGTLALGQAAPGSEFVRFSGAADCITTGTEVRLTLGSAQGPTPFCNNYQSGLPKDFVTVGHTRWRERAITAQSNNPSLSQRRCDASSEFATCVHSSDRGSGGIIQPLRRSTTPVFHLYCFVQ
jgi:hypothetical protein